MMEHAIRVASEAARAGVPAQIAEWSRSHPHQAASVVRIERREA